MMQSVQVAAVSSDIQEILFIADHLEEEGFNFRFSVEGALANMSPFAPQLPFYTIVVGDDEASEARAEIAWLLGRGG